MTNEEKAKKFVDAQKAAFAAMMATKIAERIQRDNAITEKFEEFLAEQHSYITANGEIKPPELLTTLPPKLLKPSTPQSLAEIAKMLFGIDTGVGSVTAAGSANESLASEEELKKELNNLSSDESGPTSEAGSSDF